MKLTQDILDQYNFLHIKLYTDDEWYNESDLARPIDREWIVKTSGECLYVRESTTDDPFRPYTFITSYGLLERFTTVTKRNPNTFDYTGYDTLEEILGTQFTKFI